MRETLQQPAGPLFQDAIELAAPVSFFLLALAGSRYLLLLLLLGSLQLGQGLQDLQDFHQVVDHCHHSGQPEEYG